MVFLFDNWPVSLLKAYIDFFRRLPVSRACLFLLLNWIKPLVLELTTKGDGRFSPEGLLKKCVTD